MYRAMARRTHSWYGDTPQESLHVKSQGERYAVRIGANNLTRTAAASVQIDYGQGPGNDSDWDYPTGSAGDYEYVVGEGDDGKYYYTERYYGDQGAWGTVSDEGPYDTEALAQQAAEDSARDAMAESNPYWEEICPRCGEEGFIVEGEPGQVECDSCDEVFPWAELGGTKHIGPWYHGGTLESGPGSLSEEHGYLYVTDELEEARHYAASKGGRVWILDPSFDHLVIWALGHSEGHIPNAAIEAEGGAQNMFSLVDKREQFEEAVWAGTELAKTTGSGMAAERASKDAYPNDPELATAMERAWMKASGHGGSFPRRDPKLIEDESAPGGYRVARRYMTITAACLRTAVLEQRDHDGRTEWALVGGNGVLKWFGTKKPSAEAVQREEDRVKMFEHMNKDAAHSIEDILEFSLQLQAQLTKLVNGVGAIPANDVFNMFAQSGAPISREAFDFIVEGLVEAGSFSLVGGMLMSNEIAQKD